MGRRVESECGKEGGEWVWEGGWRVSVGRRGGCECGKEGRVHVGRRVESECGKEGGK